MSNDVSTQRSTSLPMGSLKEQSTSTLQTAIRLPSQPEKTLQRANVCLAAYFEPDRDPAVKAGLLEAFVVALAPYPAWATAQAFDEWMATRKHRPSPADIAEIARAKTRRLREEIEDRNRLEQRKAEGAQPIANVDPEAAAAIIAQAGFTPQRIQAVRAAPMATTFAAAEDPIPTRVPHWTETVDPESPEMAALRAVRAANKLINQGAERAK